MGKRKLRIRLAAAGLSVLCFFGFSGFTNYAGIGTVYMDAEKLIYDGVTYHNQIAVHPSNGIERAYFVVADTSASNVKPMVFSGAVRGTATVGNMVSYAEQAGYKVLAAVNGDIYDMSTGTPKGMVIHEGNIVTSGYASDRVIAFDGDGKASMKYVNIGYTLKGTLAYDEPTSQPVVDAAGNPTGETQEGTKKVETSFKTAINYYNVPFGAAKGLHLFNRHYGNSTKTSGSCIEVVVDCGSPDGKQVQVGKTIKGTVKAVNVDACNTPIGDNEVVLSTVSGSESASKLYCMVPGSEVEISVSDNGGAGFENVREAMGIYYSLLENGNMVTSGTGLNPRTAVGIKADGSVVYYAVDGRSANSKGLGLVDLANHMKALGCVDAFNMDGGGSTAFYCRLPGKEDTATRKSSPSGGSERSVANALMFVYTGSGSSKAENLNLYPSMSLMMPGAQVQINSYGTNSNFEKASLPSGVTYSVEGDNGSISSSGLYTAGNAEGKVNILAEAGDISGKTQVEIVKTGLTLTPSTTKLVIEPGQKSDINITAKSGPLDVITSDSAFAWTCDSNIGTIDGNGLFTAAENKPETGNITATFEGYKITIPVQVGQTTVDFADTKDHWARTYIGYLAARDIANGMGGNLYMPESNLTRAQFLALLAKTLSNTSQVDSAKAAGFKDVPVNEWYYKYVNWGYENGVVSGMSDTIFNPNANITREQMCVMLCNFATSQGIALPQTGSIPNFTDKQAISSWAIDYVYTTAGAGIINGQPEGNFQPQGLATRAQAAKVVYSFLGVRDKIQ